MERVLKREAENAELAAEEAFKEAELASKSAVQFAEQSQETIDKARQTASFSVLSKLRQAHCKTLQLHCQGRAGTLQGLWATAEEASMRRLERSETEVECRGILELKGEKTKF